MRAGPFLSVKFRIPLTKVVGERRARTTKRLPALVGVERLRGRYLQRIQTMGLERFTPYVAPLPWRDLSVLCKDNPLSWQHAQPYQFGGPVERSQQEQLLQVLASSQLCRSLVEGSSVA